jgi:hypothetical protein
MIKISEAHSYCTSCESTKDVKYIAFEYGYESYSVLLCKECRKELCSMLEEEQKLESDDMKPKCICGSLEGGKLIKLDHYNDDEAALRMCKKGNKYYLIADGYDSVDKEINYCPFCGRKLS